MGDEQRLGSGRAARARARAVRGRRPTSRSRSRRSSRSSIPRRSTSSNRFEERAGGRARARALEEHLVGELIASEVEVRTGRCETFAEVAGARSAERRAQLHALAERARASRSARPARTRGPTGRSSGSSTRRTTAGTTSSSATSSGATTPSASTSTSAIRGADRAIAVATALRELPARAARALGELAVRRGREHAACTRRARRSSRASSRAAASPTRSRRWDEYERYVRFLYETGSITEHTQLWWSVRPHLAFPTVEIRICDGAARPRRGAGRSPRSATSLAARIARALRRGRAAARAVPHRLIEENLWRAIRYGLSGELIDFERGDVRPGARSGSRS